MSYSNYLSEEAFSIRKIPITTNDEFCFEDEISDKIKILELTNKIDVWEQELLFSENGFYSLKGKAVENKSREFYNELQKFINSQISAVNFKNQSSIALASKIKNAKMKAIEKQMKKHETEQLKNWEFQVYEESINSAIKRAVLYKDNPQIIEHSYKNAISVIDFMSKKENWNKKTLDSRKTRLNSEFYSQIINSFVLDKDVRAFTVFNQFKDKLDIENKEKIQKTLEDLKNNIIAYNWVKELVSYNLNDEENKKEINSVKDSDVKSLIQKYFKEFKDQEKFQETKKEEEKNENNWKEIISVLNSEPDKATLYIDTSLDFRTQKRKKEYISKIKKQGFILSDKKRFIELLNDIKSDFENFHKNPISDYRSFLAKEDFDFITELKEKTWEDYNLFVSEYNFLLSKLKKGISKDEVYKVFKLFIKAKNDYVAIHKKSPDIEVINKIIESILVRFSEPKKEKTSSIEHKKESKDTPKDTPNEEKEQDKGEIK